MLRKIKKSIAFLMTIGVLGQFFFTVPVLAEEFVGNEINQSETQEESQEQGTEESTEESTENTENTEKEERHRDVVVVLDPGHGGVDAGACRGDYLERDLVLSIAYYCKEELEKHPGFTVYMTRTDNSSPCMGRDERAEYAWEKDADLLVSFHLNATGSDTTEQSGAEVYYPNGNYKSNIGNLGYRAASSILTQLCGLGLPNNGCKTRLSNDTYYFDGTVADYLGINYWSKLKGIPGVLVEHAYINNPNDRAYYLSNDEQLKALGVADAIGIMNYFDENEDSSLALAGSWEHDKNGWWYRRRDGSYPCNGWAQIDGGWFYFDGSGYLCTGWKKAGGYWYYLGSQGMMLTGWQKVGDRWYYLSPDSGAMVEGWVKTGNQWYYLYPSSGHMATGWVKTGGKWYYLQAGSGAMVEGWQYIGNKWYYFDPSGAMCTGWYQVNGKWYYSYSSGAMASNTRIGKYRVGADGAWIP